MGKTISQQIAEIYVPLKFEDIDQRTIDNAKIFMLDCIGCILSGYHIVNAKALRAAVKEFADGGDCTIIGSGEKTNAEMAALINGTTGHSQDYDDDHREGTQHSSVAVLPAVLALAEKYGKSGKDFLVAYILGSDITIRAGEVFSGTSYYAGWHLTGTCGVFGATAGACKIMDLNEQQYVDALGVAGSEAAGIDEFNSTGAWTKRFHAGQSAKNGVLAAYMGKNGYFGPQTVFDGEHGFFHCFSFKGGAAGYEPNVPYGYQWPEKMTKDLGKKWEMADNSIKLHSCCRFTNNFCDCAIDIYNQPGFKWEDVVAIHAECNKFTDDRLCQPEDVKRHPKGVVNAQFSMFYEIACGLVKGRVLPESFTEESIKDERLAHLCDLITWEVNPDFEAVYPERYPARVTCTMKDGSKYVGEVEYPKGDPEYPATFEEVKAKFFANATLTISQEKAEKVAEMIADIENLADIRDLIALLY